MTDVLPFSKYDPVSPIDAADWIYGHLSETARLRLIMIDNDEWDASWGNNPADFGINVKAFEIHHGLMRSVRNGWLLGNRDPEHTALVRYCRERYGMEHADDISGLIQKALFAKLKDQPLNLDAAAEKMRAHYRERGMDPMTWGSNGGVLTEGLVGRAPDAPVRRFGRNGPEALRKRGVFGRLFDRMRR